MGLHESLNAADPVSAVSLGAPVDLSKVPEEIVAVMVGDDLEAEAEQRGKDVVPDDKWLNLQAWRYSMTSPPPGDFDKVVFSLSVGIAK